MRCKFRGHDLVQKIDRTVCRFKGTPYYCRSHGEEHVNLFKLTDLDNVYKRIHIDSPDFDVSSLPLGYYQETDSRVSFVERKPMRRWKQGIDDGGVSYYGISQDAGPPNKWGRKGMFCQGFVDSIEGNFMSIDDALNTLKRRDENAEIAISRDIALQWIAELQVIHVYYRMKLVGFIPPESRTVYVPSSDLGWVVTKYLSCFRWDIK